MRGGAIVGAARYAAGAAGRRAALPAASAEHETIEYSRPQLSLTVGAIPRRDGCCNRWWRFLLDPRFSFKSCVGCGGGSAARRAAPLLLTRGLERCACTSRASSKQF